MGAVEAPCAHRWNWDICVLCGAHRKEVDHRAFLDALTGVMDAAMRLNLPVTRRALHRAVQIVGYEMAGDKNAVGKLVDMNLMDSGHV